MAKLTSTDIYGSLLVQGTLSTGTLTTTGTFVAPLGAVGTPSYTFSGDLNTGVYSPGADIIAIVTGGAERLRLRSETGYTTLDSAQNFWFRKSIFLSNSLAIVNANSSGGLQLLDGDINVQAVNGSNYVTFKSTNQRVGIGTTSPTSSLQIKSASSVVRLTDTNITNANYNTFQVFAPEVNKFSLGVGTESNFKNHITIDGVNERIGIGTTTPAEKLEVRGNVRFGDAILGANSYARLDGMDQYHSIVLRGDVSGTTTQTIVPGDTTTFIEYGGAFKFRQINPTVNSTLFEINPTNSYFSGLLGINETSPSAQLHVRSGATDRIGLIINTLIGQTSELASFRVNNSTQSRIDNAGWYRSNDAGIGNSSSLNNAQLATSSTGIVISRNIADTNPSLTVNLANSGAAGDILKLQKAGSDVIAFSHDGVIKGPSTLTLDPSAHGDATGKVVILGDLQVDGTTTTINSTTLAVNDKNIELSKGATNKEASNGAGITIDLGTDGTATINYGSTDNRFAINKGIDATGNSIITGDLTVTGVIYNQATLIEYMED
jgi:hypothetical protein